MADYTIRRSVDGDAVCLTLLKDGNPIETRRVYRPGIISRIIIPGVTFKECVKVTERMFIEEWKRKEGREKSDGDAARDVIKEIEDEEKLHEP